MIKNMIKSNVGADMIAVTIHDVRGLDEYRIRNFLNEFNETYPNHIKSFSFITKKINEMELGT